MEGITEKAGHWSRAQGNRPWPQTIAPAAWEAACHGSLRPNSAATLPKEKPRGVAQRPTGLSFSAFAGTYREPLAGPGAPRHTDLLAAVSMVSGGSLNFNQDGGLLWWPLVTGVSRPWTLTESTGPGGVLPTSGVLTARRVQGWWSASLGLVTCPWSGVSFSVFLMRFEQRHACHALYIEDRCGEPGYTPVMPPGPRKS